MALTADDVREIADGFLAAAETIDKYLDDQWETISRPDYEKISESARALLRECGSMTTEAVGLAIGEMTDDSGELKQVIGQARDHLADLTAVGKVIGVAAGLVDLATAIVAKDPVAAFKSAKGLRELITV